MIRKTNIKYHLRVCFTWLSHMSAMVIMCVLLVLAFQQLSVHIATNIKTAAYLKYEMTYYVDVGAYFYDLLMLYGFMFAPAFWGILAYPLYVINGLNKSGQRSIIFELFIMMSAVYALFAYYAIQDL